MRTKTTSLLLLLSLFFLGIHCAEKTEDCAVPATTQAPLNPNGDSELALLMRAMYDEAAALRTQLDQGAPLEFHLPHEQLLTAQATEPEKAASDQYQAMANAYLHSLEQLKNAPIDERQLHYDQMVGNCMSCHQALCPGPMVRIRKLQ